MKNQFTIIRIIKLVAAILLLYTLALLFNVGHIQPIGNGLFPIVNIYDISIAISSSVPLVPGENKPCDRKPMSRCLTKAEKEAFSLSQELKDILIGLLLGDLYGQNRGGNARFIFAQGIVHLDYLSHLYGLFSNYCSNAPKIYNVSALDRQDKTKKFYSAIRFHTYSLPCFNELHELFYPLGKKMVPQNMALELPACLKQAGKL